MNPEQLRALQAPLKQKYKDDPATALVTLRARAQATDGFVGKVETGKARPETGMHPAAGGDGVLPCSGDLLLEAVASCAALTMRAVATAIGVNLRSLRVTAEGDIDFRGTLGVSKDVPVGFRDIRLQFDLDTDASDDQRATLIRLTERYCVVLQTLRQSPRIGIRQ